MGLECKRKRKRCQEKTQESAKLRQLAPNHRSGVLIEKIKIQNTKQDNGERSCVEKYLHFQAPGKKN